MKPEDLSAFDSLQQAARSFEFTERAVNEAQTAVDNAKRQLLQKEQTLAEKQKELDSMRARIYDAAKKL